MIDPTDSVTMSIPHPVRLDFTLDKRTYSVALDRDLFDQWSVIRSWAGKDNNLRGSRITHVDSFEAGMTMIQLITKRREKHGYRISAPLVSWG